MSNRRNPLSCLILFCFALRALIPVGLMLQVPITDAAATKPGEQFGFVLCPLQNPGLDVSKFGIDKNQNSGAHAHHHHADAEGEASESISVSAEHSSSFCSLWASSAQLVGQAIIPLAIPRSSDSGVVVAHNQTDTKVFQFLTPLTRAPPISPK